jgi:hypothetical protein
MTPLTVVLGAVLFQPLPPMPPRVIFEETPWWQLHVPTIVGFVQFLLLAALTFFIFWSNSAQKIREREADWYHKVVVDPAIEYLKELLGVMQKELFDAAEQVEKLRAVNIEKARGRSKNAIGAAKAAIFELRAQMGFRLAAFDPALEQGFTDELESLENQLTKWFTTHPERHSYDASESLPSILTKAQMNLLRRLMRHEFSVWGSASPWSRRGSLPPSE